MAEVWYYDLDTQIQASALSLQVFGFGYLSDIPSSGDGQELLDNCNVPNYLSFDGKGIKLKGNNQKFYSSGDYVGYISDGVSNSQGRIGNSWLRFSRNSTDSYLNFKKGITFVFYGNCCKSFYAMYRDSETQSIFEEKVEVGREIFTYKPKVPFEMLEIYFEETVYPYQFLKISEIKIGEIKVFNKFQSLSLLEEINVISDDLPINSLEFTVVLNDNEVLNGGCPVAVHSNGKYYGTFYTEDPERISKNIYSVTAFNSIKILDNTKYLDWDSDLNLDKFSSQIKRDTGITVKTDKPEGLNYRTFGHIPIDSYRYALCLHAFACRFMVDGSRSNNILLRPIPTEITSVITTADKRIIGESTFVKSKPITQVKMQYANGMSTTQSGISVDCEPNVSTVVYTETPISYINEEQDEWVQSPPDFYVEAYSGNWIRIVCYSAQSHYVECEKITYTYKNETINNPSASDNSSNEMDLSKLNLRGGSYLDGGGTVTQLPDFKKQDTLKYMQSKGTAKAKIRLQNEKVGDLIQIETAYDGIITGIIKSMAISFGYEDIADIEVLEWQNG